RSTFSAGGGTRTQGGETDGPPRGAKAFPNLGPLDAPPEKLQGRTQGQVNRHGSDDHRRERVQHEGGQRKYSAERHDVSRLHLNNSTVAKGSADHGRKRLSVNFVAAPGCTSTSR